MTRATVILATLGMLVAVRAVSAQAPEPAPPAATLPPPRTVPAPEVGPLPSTQAGPFFPPPLPGPPPPAAYPHYQDYNGPLLRGDPLLDRPCDPPPGWFAALDVSLVGTHIKNRLVADVPVAPFLPTQVHLPTAELDWTVAPRFELGYRLPQGFGEIVAAYHFLVTDGYGVLPAWDLNGSDGYLKSHVNLNVFDLDYGSREFALDPHWDMKWRVGARLGSVYFDSQAVGFFREQRTTNSFLGAGPHVGLDLWRRLDVPGLGLFARAEGAALVGRVRQSFGQSVLLDEFTLLGGAVRQSGPQAVPVFNLQAGLGYAPPAWNDYVRFALGYQLEAWWYLGQLDASRAELLSQGIFLRTELRY